MDNPGFFCFSPASANLSRSHALTLPRFHTLTLLTLFVACACNAADLTGSFSLVPPGTEINLSAEGRVDWAHWGLDATNIFNHKATASQQISNVVVIGTNAFARLGQIPIGYTWTNGTPVLQVSNTHTAISLAGISNGFSLTVPASTNEQKLNLYLGVADAVGRLKATLSDLSAPDYTDLSLDSAGDELDGVYSIHYSAASSNQTLSVQFTIDSAYDAGLGYIILEGATLTTNQPPLVTMTSPTNNSLFFLNQSITLSADASDNDGVVTNVEFFQGATSLGQASTAPYSMTWLPAPGTYTLTARATDNEGATTISTSVNLRVTNNIPPVVAIIDPLDESNFFAPASIPITATAYDTNGTVTKVEFFQASTKLGERTNAPYILTWTNVAKGFYSLTAQATDNDGASSVSSPVSVFVTGTGGALTGSVASVSQGSEVNLTSEGLADWVHWGLFTENSVDRKTGVVPQISSYSPVRNGPAFPYADNYNGYTWTDGTPTQYATNTTTGVYIVGAGDGFQITVPADPTLKTLRVYVGTFAAQGKFRAYLSDLTAPVYKDASLVNSGNGPGVVYTLNYSSASNNQTVIVSFTVFNSFNNFGNVTLQAATLVTDNNPPFATILSPADNSVFLAPTNLTIEAAAFDDGSVTNVEFFDGTNRLGNATSVPYRVIYTNAPLGSRALYVRATDNKGATYTTIPINASVIKGGGLLAGSVAPPPSQVNLTRDGRTDWAHWGLNSGNSFNHRRLVPHWISNFSEIGKQTVKSYGDNAARFSWTNGSPTLDATDTPTGVYITGLSNGFQITLPADTTPRRLRAYVGGYGAQGRMEASLGDSSAAIYRDASVASVYDNAYAVYTFDFAAATNNQTLTLKYTAAAVYDTLYGNVTLQAATLALPNFSLRNLQGSTSNFGFSFLSEPLIPYNILYVDQLDSTNWLTLTNFLGTGGEFFVTNSPLASPQRFYRVQSPY